MKYLATCIGSTRIRFYQRLAADYFALFFVPFICQPESNCDYCKRTLLNLEAVTLPIKLKLKICVHLKAPPSQYCFNTNIN